MAKGISLHIGLNYVDPKHYSGWDGKLNAAEYDANDMYLITKSQGLQPRKLIRNEATRNAVISAIKEASKTLNSNDFFVITYSGHGGQLPDKNDDEDDYTDETWCLFDGELIDDELYHLWDEFANGVRIFVISDSCNSGTITKAVKSEALQQSEFTAKFMPNDIAAKTYFQNKEFYDKILKTIKNGNSQKIQAHVKLISGSQDGQPSYDGAFNGNFTGVLKDIWNDGMFNGDYLSFYQQIKDSLTDQTPNYYHVGQPNPAFDNQKPFTI